MLWIVDCVGDPQIWQATNYSWTLCFDTWNFDLVKNNLHQSQHWQIFKLIFFVVSFLFIPRLKMDSISWSQSDYKLLFHVSQFHKPMWNRRFHQELGGLLQSGDGQNQSGGQSVFLIHCFPVCSLPDTEAACSHLRDMFLMFHWSQTQHLPSSLFITHPHTSGITLPPVSQASASHYEIKALKKGCWYFLFP